MAISFSDPPLDRTPRAVTRRCPVCEWEDIVIVGSPGEDDCPQCHAPTVVQLPADVTALPWEGKNPHAAALGRLGGKRGGRARAESLSAKRRKEIARNAALARWRKLR